ncbi:MAG: hypothetical protein H6755_03435 [Candidatus Omnitrophica bacterium]|nr:hypothetical protein [Candidatus Omnitrophota bacterium]
MNPFRQNSVLFLVSFITLFLEIALIRWVSTEIRIFAYLSNFVLLACFIGIGSGCYLSSQKNRLYISFLALSLLIIFIQIPIKINLTGHELDIFTDIPVLLAAFKDSVIHYQRTSEKLRLMQAIGVISTLTMFFVIMLALFPLGQILGRVFDNHKDTIKAYSINVGASLLGVWAFSGISFVYAPPQIWLVISLILTGILMILLKDFSKKNIVTFFICLIVIYFCFAQKENPNDLQKTIWSPYQKLTLRPVMPFKTGIDPFTERSIAGYMIDVNNVGFMNMLNLSDSFKKAYSEYFVRQPMYKGEPQGFQNLFNFPYMLKAGAESVVIFGAGAGADVAGALRAGVKKVDAVEIDPGIYRLGLDYHPEEPYSDPRVHVFIDDARSYVKKTKDTYDIVYFGLLDAHAQSSSMNNMRMDHYVYTKESFEEAKQLLNPDGLFVVNFFVQRIWIGKRIKDLVRDTFGWEPIVVAFDQRKNGLGKVAIISGHNREYIINLIKNSEGALGPFIVNRLLNYDQGMFDNNLTVTETNDNWPYLYLRQPLIPEMYLLMTGILIGLFILSKGIFIKKGQRLDFHFFFLGAAFLLLEFQNINKTALLFGSTWIVNAVNISAILIFILLANLFVSKITIRNLKIPYLCLFLSLLIIFVVPLNIFNALGYWPKSILAGIMLNLPIFFAGIIFITSFKATDNKSVAFGSNLIGAAAGGLLECLPFLIGIRMLVLVTMGVYFLSLLFIKRVEFCAR